MVVDVEVMWFMARGEGAVNPCVLLLGLWVERDRLSISDFMGF